MACFRVVRFAFPSPFPVGNQNRTREKREKHEGNLNEEKQDANDGASSVTANIANADEADQLIVGAKLGFARLNQATGKLSYIRKAWGEDDGPGKAEM